MKFSTLRFIMGLLVTIPSVYATEDTLEKEKTGHTLTFKEAPLFMSSQPTDSVTFTMAQLYVNGQSTENTKAQLLFKVLQDCRYTPAIKKIYHTDEITLHGITIADLRLIGNEPWPTTLNGKIQNDENDKLFAAHGYSIIADYSIQINPDFLITLETAVSKADERATKLSLALEKIGILKPLKSREGMFNYSIPEDLFVGSDLDKYYNGIPEKKLRKLQNFFGLKLEETTTGKLLRAINPEEKLTSKEEMKKLLERNVLQAQEENSKLKSEFEASKKSVQDLTTQVEILKTSEEQLKTQQTQDKETIAKQLQEKETLHSKILKITSELSSLTDGSSPESK